MNQKMFNSDVELGKFLGSIHVIQDAYQAISDTSSPYQLHTSLPGIKVLAFDDYTIRFHDKDFDLVSSEEHKVLDFISTKVNPKFTINKAAVELFQHLSGELSKLKDQLINGPLVVTGRGLGGYLAILFTLQHQHAIDLEESSGFKTIKRPICITFGTPLLGDQSLQRAISERPQWSSFFLNVVAKTDPLASFFSSNTLYKPFGTFLFCTESNGHTTFEDQAAILAVLDVMASSNAGNSQMHDYKNELGSIRRKVLYRGVSEVGGFNLNPLRAGIQLQFREIDVLKDIPNDLIGKTEDKLVKMIKSKKNVYEPTKKLNEMKISLTYMEWYMKSRRSTGGYYDSYKNAKTKNEMESVQEIIKHQRILNQYWKKTVEDKDRMPQTEGAKLRQRWLYAGTNFRRIIEPLYIAEHYKNGKTNYIAHRPQHFVLLEKWSEEEKKDWKPSEGRTKAASLTEDSCFWARVEEALISLKILKTGVDVDVITNIESFEDYVLCAIKDRSLSPDVFLEDSSLIKWWNEYNAYKKEKGSSNDSELAQYMNDGSYESYQ